MLRRPPEPSLFPYTTLFRSGRGRTDAVARGQRGRSDRDDGERRRGHRRDRERAVERAGERDVLAVDSAGADRSEEHTSELQSHVNLVCRLLLEKKKRTTFLS